MKLLTYSFRTILLFLIFLVSSCAMVSVKDIESKDYIAMKRSNILVSGTLSEISEEEIKKAGLDVSNCAKELVNCIQVIKNHITPMGDRKISTLSELWLYHAIQLKKQVKKTGKNRNDKENTANEIKKQRQLALIESARYAYIYLFSPEFSKQDRSFQDRYTQIKDFYTYTIQTFIHESSENYKKGILSSKQPINAPLKEVNIGDWSIKVDSVLSNEKVEKLIPASSLKFKGLMGSYRQDGLGAEFVKVTAVDANKPFGQMETPPATAILKFSGTNTQELINTHQAELIVLDPFKEKSVRVQNKVVPLAANFTAGYGYWLANSDFAKQSLKTLLGKSKEAINKPHIYLMQPYDPNRRIILMVHGLASSPEAWVNLANELMADENIRDNYQIWNVYYPTNIPIFVNLVAIKRIFKEALAHYDPSKQSQASKNAVIIGHSMGGIISRLMISNSQNELIDVLVNNYKLKSNKITPELKQELVLTAMPQFQRAIFLAAPHKGTDIAGERLGRLVSKIVSIPFNVLLTTGNVFKDILTGTGIDLKNQPKLVKSLPNSIDNLKKDDPFIAASSSLPISNKVTYHSIIANRYKEKSNVALENSDDGLVPYWSAHLKGAESEKVIHSWHSVQETPAAIFEIIRILYKDMILQKKLTKNGLKNNE